MKESSGGPYTNANLLLISVADKNFDTFFHNADKNKAWLQFDLIEEYSVFGIVLFIRDNLEHRLSDVEVRVGNLDVSGSTAQIG